MIEMPFSTAIRAISIESLQLLGPSSRPGKMWQWESMSKGEVLFDDSDVARHYVGGGWVGCCWRRRWRFGCGFFLERLFGLFSTFLLLAETPLSVGEDQRFFPK